MRAVAPIAPPPSILKRVSLSRLSLMKLVQESVLPSRSLLIKGVCGGLLACFRVAGAGRLTGSSFLARALRFMAACGAGGPVWDVRGARAERSPSRLGSR